MGTRLKHRILALEERVQSVLAKAWIGESQLSAEDQDALTLYGGRFWIRGGMSPDYHQFEELEIYRRGKEVHAVLFGEATPLSLDPSFQRGTCASFMFEKVHHREPVSGDQFAYSEVQQLHANDVAAWSDFIAAWGRRITALPCPLRVDDGKLFVRIRSQVPGGAAFWKQERCNSAEFDWWRIECNALQKQECELPKQYRPTVEIVQFLGVIDGKHHCRTLKA